MLNNLLQNKFLIYLVYGLIFLPIISPWYRYLFFLLGLLMGLALLELDKRVLHKKYNDELPGNEDNETKSNNAPFLATRSTLFLLVLIPLTFFVVSSTAGAVGKGFVLGLMLGLVKEMWMIRNNIDRFSNLFLSQLKLEPTRALTSKITVGYSAVLFLFTLWSLLAR